MAHAIEDDFEEFEPLEPATEKQLTRGYFQTPPCQHGRSCGCGVSGQRCFYR